MDETTTVTSERLAEAMLRLLAHDLRAPLGPLTLAVSTLEEDPALTEDQRMLARLAGAQAARAARLIDAVIAAVRGPRHPAPRATDLGELALEVLERYRDLGGDGNVTAARVTAPVDPELMRDAVLNLVEVAGGGAGRVDLGVTRDARGVRLSLTASDPDACAAGLTAELPRDARSALALGAAAVIRAHGGIVVATPHGADIVLEAP